MTRVQKAQLRQSELKTEIAAELDKENEQREEGRLERLTREAQAVEVELRADLTIEAEAAIPDCIDTPEGRELRRRNSIYDRGCGTRGWQYGESTSQLFSGGAVVSAIGVEMSWSDWMKTSMNGMVSFLESLIVSQDRETGRKLQMLNGRSFHPASAATTVRVAISNIGLCHICPGRYDVSTDKIIPSGGYKVTDVRSEVLTIKIEPALKQRAREVAEAHGLTMSNFIHGALKAILSAYEPQPMRMLYDRLPSAEKSHVEKWLEIMMAVEVDVLCERCRPTFWNSPDTWYALSQKQMEFSHCIMCDENDPAAS